MTEYIFRIDYLIQDIYIVCHDIDTEYKNMRVLYVDELTAMQQKIIMNVLTHAVKKSDIEKYEMPIEDFKSLVGIKVSRNYFAELRRVVSELIVKKIIIDEDDGCLLFTTWFSGIALDYKRKVIFTFDERAKPYLFKLGRTYTETTLENIKGLRSKYSIKLYEKIKSCQSQGRSSLNLTIEELKEYLGLGSRYTRIGDLKRRILDEVKNDISRHTDLQINYILLKTGRQYTDIQFRFEKIQQLTEEENREELLKQVNLDELDEYIMRCAEFDEDLRERMEVESKNQIRKRYVEEFFEYMLKNIEDMFL
ncbi:MAG: replication initiation protein [Desulfamplus sp.]